MKKVNFIVVVIAVLLFFAPSLPSSPSMEELEGTLEIMMATEIGGEKTCKQVYFINTGGKRTQFSMPAHTPPLSPGQKIKISGRWEESAEKKGFYCRKVEAIAVAPVAKKATSSADGISSYLPNQTPVLGEQRTLVILIAFPDHEVPEWGKEKAENKIFSSEPTDKYPNDHSDNAYWKECSVEKMWLNGECLDGWKDMPYPATEYGYGGNGELYFFHKLQRDALDAIDPYADFTQYDRLVFIRTGKNWGYAFATLGKWTFDTADGSVELSTAFVTEHDVEIRRHIVSHELGHGFGLVHANSIIASTGVISTYGDTWENRGLNFAQLDGLHKYMLGWLDIGKVEMVSSSGEYLLDQRELSSSGVKLLVIFLGYDDRGESILYYLEYFKELGEFDSQVFFDFESDSKKDAVLLRKYKREAVNYDSLVFMEIEDPDNPASEKIPIDLESQEFCDSMYEDADYEKYGICVQVIQKTGTEAGAKAKVKITLPPPPPCAYTISPTSQSFSASGGAGSVGVTTSSGCNWTAVSSASWLTVTSGGSGTGNGTVAYEVSANTSTSPRTGTMTIAGQTFIVTQDGITCAYTISPTSQSFSASGGAGSVGVTTSSGCNWTAVSSASWLTVTSGGSGTGNGTVAYEVSANTSTSPRTGTMTVEEQTFTVNQESPPPPPVCEAETITISPPVLTLKKKTRGDVVVAVTGADGCAVEGTLISATVSSGKKRITVSPSSGETDENGLAVFTITAKKKTGKAEVTFQADDLESLMTIKVRKKKK